MSKTVEFLQWVASLDLIYESETQLWEKSDMVDDDEYPELPKDQLRFSADDLHALWPGKEQVTPSMVEALRQIANPIGYMQDEAKRTGQHINGQYAISLSQNAAWLSGIAEKALKSVTTPSPDVAGSDAVVDDLEDYWAYRCMLTEACITDSGTTHVEKLKKFLAGSPINRDSLRRWKKKSIDLQHPQPAGASVEQAAHDYVKGMLGDYDPELQEEYDAILAHVLKGVELAGAAFQAAQGHEAEFGKGGSMCQCTQEDKPGQTTVWCCNNCGLPDEKGWGKPAPAAVSAGVWRNCADSLPRGIKNVSRILSTDIIREIDNKEPVSEYFKMYAEKWGLENFEWLDESAPGIPDVRELVEGLEDVAKCMHLCPKCKRTVQNTITALAGIKRK